MSHPNPFYLRMPRPMSEEEFFQFCRENDAYRIEREPSGLVMVMEPTGFETGARNTELTTELNLWNRRHRRGRVGDSSTGYTLPNKAVRSPDASWISLERLSATTPADREGFVHAVPEFVAEIRSPSDSPRLLREKMREYLQNGVLLAWYIDVPDQFVEIYRADGTVSRVDGFDNVINGENVLEGFAFELGWIK